MAGPTLFIHIFIHGTILAGYFFLNPFAAWQDRFDTHCTAFRATARARETMTPAYIELIGKLGLADVTDQVSTGTHLYDTCAAITIIRGFHTVFKHHMSPGDTVRYYTFGWSGLLSERERLLEAEKLYDELVRLIRQLEMQHPECPMVIRLYGHSHGGQLIAHLGRLDIQKKYAGSDGLTRKLDTAFLCATPLVPESIQLLVLSNVFDKVVNVHSQADRIQDMDFISTPHHICFQRFDQLNVPLPSGHHGGTTYVDLAITVEKCAHAANHSSFFSCNDYRLPGYVPRLVQVKKTLALFRPLPLLIWYPIIHDLMDSCMNHGGHYGAQANIYRVTSQERSIQISLTYPPGSSANPQEPPSSPLTVRESAIYRLPLRAGILHAQYIKRACNAGLNHLKRLIKNIWG